MGKGNTWSQDILKIIFQAIAAANIMDNAASAPLTNLYISLHTANPGASGDQTTSEAAYTGYARVAVARTNVGWTLTGQSISPASNVTFPTATGGSETETYVGIGAASSGAGILLYSGALASGIPVTSGVTPILSAASTIVES